MNLFSQLVAEAVRNRWCMNIPCTTCGGGDFRGRLKAMGPALDSELAALGPKELARLHNWPDCVRIAFVDLSCERRMMVLGAWLKKVEESDIRFIDATVYHLLPGNGSTEWIDLAYSFAIKTKDTSLAETILLTRGKESTANSQFMAVVNSLLPSPRIEAALHKVAPPIAQSSKRMDIQARVRGALLGLAVGDALGTTLEFKAPGSFERIDDMVGGGPFQLKAGQWTDDTSMALCLAESLLTSGSFNPKDQLERYCRWYREGHLSSTGRCFDIGNTVRDALVRFEGSGQPYCGSAEANTAGNGSLMRLAPVPLLYFRQPREAIQRSAESSRTTHGALEAVDACRYFASLLVGAINAVPKQQLLKLKPVFDASGDEFQKEPLCPKVKAIAEGSFRKKMPPAIRGTGYVIDSLEAALWAFYRSKSFREGALLAVNLGNDADTTGAIYGQLAGAYYGDAGIPDAWRFRLANRELLESFADRLWAAAVPTEGPTSLDS